MEAITPQIKTLLQDADEGRRQEILESLRRVQVESQTPYELLSCLLFQSLPQFACIRIGVTLGIFNKLSRTTSSLSLNTLADDSGAAPELLGRILRFLASVNLIDETERDEFAANHATRILKDAGWEGGIHLICDLLAPSFQALPGFLAGTHYQDITSNAKTPFQDAFHTELSCFDWLPNQPELFANFHKTMAIQRPGDWLSIFPVEKEIGNWAEDPRKVIFVDLGGGHGHQCVGFRKRFPGLKGRFVLQDLEEIVAQVKPLEGVEIMAQNAFEPQAIIGAKFYYLRTVFHNWPDEKCVEILQNLAPALVAESRILIDDMLLPNAGVPWQAAGMDLVMMNILGAGERTRAQWDGIVERAGMKISEVYTYNPLQYNSILVVVPN